MNKIMIVGSGPWQIHLIKKAKAMGLFVINTNLHVNSEGFPYADVGIPIDIYDKDGHLEIAKRYDVHGVTTDQIDIAVPTVAYVCEKLGLPGIGIEIGELFTSKIRMREFCKAHGILQPRYQCCRSLEEAVRAALKIGFPVIIKPTNNRSSRGVHKILNKEELALKLPDTKAWSREPWFLVEEYIGGFELSVEGFKTRRKHTTLGVSRKDQFGHNTVLDSKVFYSKDNSSINYEELKNIQDGLVNASGLPFGITHTEFKCWNDKFYLIEFAARGGGANISSHIIPLISGVDVTELLIRMAMGENILDVKPAKQDKAVALEFFILREGKVKSIHGLEKIQAMKNVVNAGLTFKVGDTLTLPPDGGARAGHFIAYAENDERLNALCETIKKTLVVEYE